MLVKKMPSIAHTVELALRQFQGPFLATIEMDTGVVWVGQVTGLIRDAQDTWIVISKLTQWPYGGGEVAHLRAGRVKCMSSIKKEDDNATRHP